MNAFLREFSRSDAGNAGAELALLLPLLTLIMFGGMEVAHFFWTEHTVVKTVRDGARFAGRQKFANFNCDDDSIDATVEGEVKKLTRTGFIDGDDPETLGADNPLIRGWSDDSTVTVELECIDDADFSTTGIYRDSTGTGTSEVMAMRVTVTADVTYPSLFEGFGFLDGRTLTATAQSPVMGF